MSAIKLTFWLWVFTLPEYSSTSGRRWVSLTCPQVLVDFHNLLRGHRKGGDSSSDDLENVGSSSCHRISHVLQSKQKPTLQGVWPGQEKGLNS